MTPLEIIATVLRASCHQFIGRLGADVEVQAELERERRVGDVDLDEAVARGEAQELDLALERIKPLVFVLVPVRRRAGVGRRGVFDSAGNLRGACDCGTGTGVGCWAGRGGPRGWRCRWRG